MKINIFGMGYVGFVSAVCRANNGFHVTGVDVDTLKVNMINQGTSPIVEPGLQEMIKKSVTPKRLRATANNTGPADIPVVCVGTPSNENGSIYIDVK